jgi:hypothetical protein
MKHLKRLQELYAFPGFIPQATVRGLFGDSWAVVLTLKRLRKKRPVASVAKFIAATTTKLLVGLVTYRPVTAACIWNSRFGGCSAAVVGP